MHHYYLQGSFPCQDWPFTPGYEFCGVVASTGTEVKHIKSGDRVSVDPNARGNFIFLYFVINKTNKLISDICFTIVYLMENVMKMIILYFL